MESEWQKAAEAMAVIQERQAWLADRLVAPCWFHPLLGLLGGGLVASGEARSGVLLAWAIVVYTVACGTIMWVNQRRVGGLTFRYFDRPMTMVSGLQILACAVTVAAACWLDFAEGLRGALLVAGLLIAVLIIEFGRLSDRVLRQRLTAQPS